MKKIKNEIILILIVAMWGLSFSLTKPILNQMTVFNFLAYRFLIGGGMLFIILWIRGQIRMNQQVINSGIWTGILMFSAYYCHMVGLKMTSISNNAFIVGSSLIFIPFALKLLYKETVGVLTLLQIIIATFGLAIITLFGQKGGLNLGDYITLLGTIIFAIFTVVVEKSVRKYDVNSFTTVQLLTVGFLSLIMTTFQGEFVIHLPVVDFLNLIFMGIVLTGLFFFLLNQLQRDLSAASVTIIYTLEPFFAAVFAWLILREQAGLNVLAGGMLIMLSVLLPALQEMITTRQKRYEYP